jgi:CelD/BcsL family acetyltransferase involved in cellulose biosynthesis
MEAVTLPRALTERIRFTLESATNVPELTAQWRELETRANASFFQSWDWIGCWVKEAQLVPLVLLGRQAGRIVLMGLLQPSRQRRHLAITTNALLLHHLGRTDKDILCIAYNGFVTDSDVTWHVVQDSIDFLFGGTDGAIAEREVVPLDELCLKGVPQEYEQNARPPGINQVVVSRHRSWKVDLDEIRATGRGYIEHLSSNTRYQIRRSIRLYKARGRLFATRAGNVREALEFFDSMKDLNKAYWTSRGQTASFAYPFFESFHRRLIRACIPRGTVEMLRVTAGDQAIGYLYNFVYRGWVYAYQSAFLYEDDPKLKPGLVCHQLCIERHLQERAHLYDFLAGNSRYKGNLGKPGPDMLDIVFQRPLFKLRVENTVRKFKRDLGSWLRRGHEPGHIV